MTRTSTGFSLTELLIVVVIVGVLAAIAYPSYVSSVTRSKRSAAQACLGNFATHMERFYTTNMRYDQDAGGTAIDLPDLDCASAQNTGQDYTYSLSAVGTTSFTLQAAPTGAQATRDAGCGTLTLDQAGTRGVTGSAGVDKCW